MSRKNCSAIVDILGNSVVVNCLQKGIRRNGLVNPYPGENSLTISRELYKGCEWPFSLKAPSSIGLGNIGGFANAPE
ncbi:hypothetical protein TNCV_259331 [Trichonephila clavipes]|uniref:Uncharacterized protein n=1 Tax=Trichonephila clavipes TaxID=2585209 RepID=A0A8X6RQH3_TRICX|nr:hypothetical protein TNCV_259331 [Trichonephila clavipes]